MATNPQGNSLAVQLVYKQGFLNFFFNGPELVSCLSGVSFQLAIYGKRLVWQAGSVPHIELNFDEAFCYASDLVANDRSGS